MADAPNIYEELHTALKSFQDFLDANTATDSPLIKAIGALKVIVPQVTSLLDTLISLMNGLKTAIDNIKLQGITAEALGKIADFSKALTTLLQVAETLLPDQKSAIDQALNAAKVVEGLPSFDQLKDLIKGAIDAIIVDLGKLKAA